LYGVFVWARRALNGRKLRFPARAAALEAGRARIRGECEARVTAAHLAAARQGRSLTPAEEQALRAAAEREYADLLAAHGREERRAENKFMDAASFAEADADGDGKLTKAEFIAWHRKRFHRDPTVRGPPGALRRPWRFPQQLGLCAALLRARAGRSAGLSGVCPARGRTRRGSSSTRRTRTRTGP
jgi:hypothetical protein